MDITLPSVGPVQWGIMDFVAILISIATLSYVLLQFIFQPVTVLTSIISLALVVFAILLVIITVYIGRLNHRMSD